MHVRSGRRQFCTSPLSVVARSTGFPQRHPALPSGVSGKPLNGDASPQECAGYARETDPHGAPVAALPAQPRTHHRAAPRFPAAGASLYSSLLRGECPAQGGLSQTISKETAGRPSPDSAAPQKAVHGRSATAQPPRSNSCRCWTHPSPARCIFRPANRPGQSVWLRRFRW